MVPRASCGCSYDVPSMASDSTTDDEDLRLNTLHRFAKHSPSLLLQEYSHCEVPAGCGGVVLRWLDPQGGVPVLVQVASLGQSETWLDGEQLSSSHVMLGMGRHVIAVHLSEVGTWRRDQPPIMMPAPFSVGVVSETMGVSRDLVRDATDVRWRWSPRVPESLWTDMEFDDRRWLALGDGTALADAVPEAARYGYDRALERDQAMFAIPQSEAWIRLLFTVSVENTRTDRSRGEP